MIKRMTSDQAEVSTLDSLNVGQGYLLQNYQLRETMPTDVEALSQLYDRRFLPVVYRKIWQEIFSQLNELTSQHQPGNKDMIRKIISGGTGVGKSLLLYLIVCWCRAHGWYVIYIPVCGGVNNIDKSRMIAINCLRALNLNPGTDPDQTLKNLIIDKLTNDTTTQPFLLAIDQWNAVHGSVAPGSFAEFVNEFSNLKPHYGAIFYAVSSSFDPVPRIRDGDSTISELSLVIPKYNSEEFRQVKTFYTKLGLWPRAAQLDDEKVHLLTGGLPRLLRVLIYEMRTLSPDNYNNLLFNYQTLAINYFNHRVTHIFDREQLTAIEKTRIMDFAAQILCFRYVPVDAIPIRWLSSGLLEQEIINGQTHYYPACEYVKRALFNYFSNDLTSHLTTLASDPNCAPRALELMVLFSLRRCDFTIKLCNTGLEESADSMDYRFCRESSEEPIIQEHPKYHGKYPVYKQIDIKPGTLVVCHNSHPVVDFVFRSSTGVIFFIQVSTQSYSNHGSKLNDLYTKRYYYEGMPRSESPKSLFYIYMRMAGIKIIDSKTGKTRLVNVDDTIKQFKGNAVYLYITTSNVRTRDSISSVRLIDPSDFNTVFRINWLAISKYFSTS